MPYFFFILNTKESSAESHICISKVLPLTNSALLGYLAERKINIDAARQQCSEVHYTVNGKDYFAIGFANDAGGYELRNKYFKGSASPKGITTKSHGTDECIVFEGFMDYLSYLTLKQQQQPRTDSALINLLEKYLDTALKTEKIVCKDLINGSNSFTSHTTGVAYLGYDSDVEKYRNGIFFTYGGLLRLIITVNPAFYNHVFIQLFVFKSLYQCLKELYMVINRAIFFEFKLEMINFNG